MTEGQAEKASASKTAKKTTKTTKAPAKKSPAKKSTARATKAASGDGESRRASARAEAPPRMTASRVAGEAVRQLQELIGSDVESVVGLERTDDGWTVRVEVLELRRIPSTTDVLATYEVAVDRDGELEGYRRQHRYVRGTPGDD